MEETTFSMDSLYEKAKAYTDTSLELAKLKAVDKAAEVSAALLPRLIMLVLLLLFLFCANVALGLWLGALMGASYYGFAAVAGVYVLIALVIRFVLKERISKSVADAIVSRLMS